MNYMKSNKNGVKLLAAIMVLAVALAGVTIVFNNVNDVDAETIPATYVSANGDDSVNDGSESKPFKTISKAMTKGTSVSVVLLSDIAESVVVGNTKNITIDLNGHTLSYSTIEGQGAYATPVIKNLGTLVINDSSNNNAGKITRGAADNNEYYLIVNEGTLTINGGEIYTSKTFEDTASIIINNCDCSSTNPAKLIINGGKITSSDSNCIKNDEYGDLVINGGTFTQNYQLDDHKSILMTYGTAVINGGTFTQNVSTGHIITASSYSTEHSTVTIKGGQFNGKADSSIYFGEWVDNGGTSNSAGIVDVIIEGGQFDAPIKTDSAKNNDKNLIVKTIVNIPGVSDLTKIDIDLKDKSSLSLGSGTIFNNTDVENGINKAVLTDFKAGSSGVTLKQGSVTLTGTVTVDSVNAAITNSGGNVVLENVVITNAGSNNATITVNGTLTVKGNVILPEKVELKTNTGETNKIIIDKDATLSVSGIVSGNVENNGSISIDNVDASIPDSIGGTGSVDVSGVASDGTLSGTYNTTTTFTQNQIITATGNITLVKGTTFTFEGTFIVPEGVTVTVEDGAKLVIATSTGKLVNDGTIVIESRASAVWNGSNHVSGYEGAFVLSDGEVINNGVFELDYSEPETDVPSGWVMNIASGTFTNKGTINVGDDSEFVVNGNFVNEGTLNLNGEIVVNNNGGVTSAPTNAVITNSGDMILSGETRCAFTIYITSLDATVTFDGMASMSDSVTITVSNEKYTETTRKLVAGTSEVKVGFGNLDTISGLKITMDVVKNDAESTSTETKYDKVLVIDGAVSASTTEEVENPVIAMFITTTGKNMIPGEVSLTEKVTMTIGGTMTVDGKLTYTVKDSKGGIALADSSAVLNVNGTVSGNDKQITVNGGKINALYYKIDGVSSTPDMHYYTTIYNAVASEAKTIKVLGTITITEDVTIPATMTLDNSTGLIVIDDAKVTMTTGSKLRNGSSITAEGEPGYGILVKGTLYVENVKETLKTPGKIISEVVKNGEKDRTYTSLALALSGAADGETIVLSDNATISKDATIRAGVTVDTNNKNLTVGNDATLTVEGTLYINGTTGKLILAPEGPTGNITKKAGAVVLKGTIKSVLEVPENLKIAGAYYSITDGGKKAYYVETVDVAAPKITTFDGTANNNAVVEIKTFDDKFTLGDVSFTGNTAKTAVVVIKGQVTAKTITLDVATLQINDGVKFVGQVTNSTGTVALDGTAGADFEVKSITKDDAKTFTVAGNFTVATKKNVTLSGDVTVGPFTSDVTVIDGNIVVADNSNLGKLTVNGTVTVDVEKTLTAGDINVFGSVDAADATETKSAGRVVATNIYLGLSESEVIKTTAATAAIDGIFQISGLLYVLDGCTVSEDLVKDAKSLEVYVEDKLWMTVYAVGTVSQVTISNIPLENVDLAGWTYKNGKAVTMPATINDNKVYAKIEYNVYTVNVQVAEGIDDVYMDGVLMKYTGSGFTAKISAGQHTISYTLSNGYGGEATMLVNGEKVTGYGFTASGSFDTDATDDVEYNIILQGIEKTGYTPDAPDNNGGSDGMSITDYLLIVLVVLIVIMAILVAIRMMRS